MNPLEVTKTATLKLEKDHGLPALAKVINHPQLRHLPFYLETPNELSGYAKEIEVLRNAYEEADKG